MGVCHLKKNAVLAKGQDILLEKFRAELIDYKPNWEIIIKNYKKDVSNKEFSKICGERIREFRRNTILPYEAKHLTQGRLGDLLGITKQAVSKLEKGGYIDIPSRHILFIASYFDIGIGYLMGIFDDMDFELSDPYQYFLEHPDSEYLQLKDKVSPYNVIPFKLYGTGNEKESADYVYYHMSAPVMGNLCNFLKRINGDIDKLTKFVEFLKKFS